MALDKVGVRNGLHYLWKHRAHPVAPSEIVFEYRHFKFGEPEKRIIESKDARSFLYSLCVSKEMVAEEAEKCKSDNVIHDDLKLCKDLKDKLAEKCFNELSKVELAYRTNWNSWIEMANTVENNGKEGYNQK